MSTQAQEELIKEVAEDILGKMGFTTQLTVTRSITENEDREKITLEIESPDSKFIIGKYGTALVSLQHILKLLVRAKSERYINFSVDVNGYRQQQDNYIKDTANDMAKEALINGRAVTLEPMNGYERRLVHLELENNTEVKTESIGEGEDRKVIISPSLED